MDEKRERTAAGTRGSYLGHRFQSVTSCGDTQTKVCSTLMHVRPSLINLKGDS